jgi:hypothetical protein
MKTWLCSGIHQFLEFGSSDPVATAPKCAGGAPICRHMMVESESSLVYESSSATQNRVSPYCDSRDRELASRLPKKRP